MNSKGAPRKFISKTSERRSLGLCIRCDTPSASYYCPVHAEQHRACQNRRNIEKKKRRQRIEEILVREKMKGPIKW